MRSARIFVLPLALVLATGPTIVMATGYATSDNFHVYAPTETLADEILETAERLREELAVKWLNRPLPPGIGKTILHVSYGEESSGLFWAIDNSERTFHKLWVTLVEGEPAEHALAHEITHLVLATRYPERLPLWVEEGIASQADDARRAEIRGETIRWYQQTGNWPPLGRVLSLGSIAAKDQANYALAASVTEYLLTAGDTPTLLKFARDGKQQGWDRALATHYRIRNVGELEARWKRWTAGPRVQAAAATSASRF